MKKQFDGLCYVHLELTSFCNKDCWMCGRRKIDRDYKEIQMNYGHMGFELVKKIASQLPKNIVIQFHNNGDPFLYPKLKETLKLFPNNIKCLNTNGKLLIKKANEVLDILDTITISVIENDPESDSQYKQVVKFLELKRDKKPLVVFRLLGNVAIYNLDYKHQIFENKKERWYKLAKKYNCIIATRTLHDPMGSKNYKKIPTIPEIGMCIEILTHMTIDRFGDVYPCVRFNPSKYNLLGNIKNTSLIDMWNGEERQKIIELHKQGKRNLIPLCDKCEFWGVAIGGK